MKELRPDYYFKDVEACPCPDAFKGIEYVWEALNKKNNIFKNRDEIRIGNNIVFNPLSIIGIEMMIYYAMPRFFEANTIYKSEQEVKELENPNR